MHCPNMRGVNPMMQHVTTENIAAILAQILSKMEGCISEQEAIILEEREAMQTFDANALTGLVARRERSQSMLSELEHQCQVLCSKVKLPNHAQHMSLLIDNFAQEQADALQNTRIELLRRMQALERDHVENHIRLRAAWNVTTNILTHIGAIEAKTTYTNPAYQAAR